MICVYQSQNLSELFFQATKKLSNILIKIHSDTPILFLCSGGSAINLVNGLTEESIPNDLTIVMLDERYSTDPRVNNFSILKQSDFYKNFHSNLKVTFYDTSVKKGETLVTYADRYEEMIGQWIASHPGGKVIATFGIGDDGHISGLMPYRENKDYFYEQFVYTERIIVGYDAKGKNPYPLRATTTISFLQKYVISGIVYVPSANKFRIVEKILTTTNELYHSLPGRSLAKINDLYLYRSLG